MSGGYGPPLLDFSPIGDLAGTFFRARKQAREDKFEEEAPALFERAYEAAYGQGSAPAAPAAPSDPSTPLSSFAKPRAGETPTFASIEGTSPTGGVGKVKAPYEIAATQLGKREAPDRAALQDYLKTGGVNLDPATLAWCAAFVNSSLGQAGIKGTGSNLARSFLNYGEAVDQPQKGDIAVFSRGDPMGPYGHVGFFEGYDPDGRIRVLGGNQSDSVSIAAQDPSRLLGFRRIPSSGGAKLGSDPVLEVSQAAGNPADFPAQGARNTQGFVVPGQTGGAPAIDKQLMKQLYANPNTRAFAISLLNERFKGRDVKTVDLGNAIGIMDNQGNILRQIPKQKDQTPQLVGTDETGRAWVRPGEDLPENISKPRQPKDRYELVKGKNGTPIGIYDKVEGRQLSSEEAQQRGIQPGAPAQESAPDFKDISGIRKEIQDLPAYKSYASAIPAYTSMLDAAKRNTKTADLNMVYALAKIMDPTSVVREGEIQMANDTQGFADRLNGFIQSIQGEGRLAPETRAGLVQEAESRMNGFKQSFDADIGQYCGFAQRWKINEADIIPNLPGMPQYDPREFNTISKTEGAGSGQGARSIPEGYSAGRVLSDAKDAYKKAAQQPDPVVRKYQQDAIRNRLKSYKIDPSRLDE
jgi:uncharacterized protein (TIGR02594 family)